MILAVLPDILRFTRGDELDVVKVLFERSGVRPMINSRELQI
jgi:hypothetical protein